MANRGTTPPNNSIDFNTLRKKRQRVTNIKRLAILAGLIVVVLLAVFLNNILVEESITTRISDLVSGFGGSGYPVALPGGVIRDIKHCDNHLAVLNDTNLYLYSIKGKQVGNFQQMSDNTVALASSGRMLTYDTGGKRYRVHSKSKTLHEQETEFSIITACLNERGDYAIVSSSKQFICEINVYNKRYEKVLERNFTSDLVSAVSLSPKGNVMAAGWINGRGGVLYSGVDLYPLYSEEKLATLELDDNFVLDVRFLEEDRIAVLTDRQYLIMDASGQLKHSYDFAGRQLGAIEQEGRTALLLLQDAETRRKDIVLLGDDLSEKAVYSTAAKTLDMAIAAKKIYLLEDDAIRTFDRELNEIEQPVPVQHASYIHAVAGRLYYLTRDEICVLGVSYAGGSSLASESDASKEGESEDERTSQDEDAQESNSRAQQEAG